MDDPDDGLIVDEVGPWAISEKHPRLKAYIDVSSPARAKYLPPLGRGGAGYIDLYSGPGRSLVRDSGRTIDGSPLVAYNAALTKGSSFSELHLNDSDPAKASAVEARIKKLGGKARVYSKPAATAVDEILNSISPFGLHFAFLDPYNLEQLPFSIIRKLAAVRRMDMLIHVSVQDPQRNLDRYSAEGGVLDSFVPGWRSKVDLKQSIKPLRSALLECWLNEIRALGTKPAQGIELVVGPGGQRLYWLVFVSANDLGQKLWNAVRNIHGQKTLEL